MNKAVSNPVEGTLVSVIRDCCQLGTESFATVTDLLAKWHAQALVELNDTPNKLIVDGACVYFRIVRLFLGNTGACVRACCGHLGRLVSLLPAMSCALC